MKKEGGAEPYLFKGTPPRSLACMIYCRPLCGQKADRKMDTIMKNILLIAILIMVAFIGIRIFAMEKRIIEVNNNLQDLKILNGLRQPIELPEKAIEITPEMFDLINCESSWDFEARGDNGRAFGPAQFWEETFDWLAKLSGEKGLEYENPGDQLFLLKWAMENNYSYLWSCAKILGIK